MPRFSMDWFRVRPRFHWAIALLWLISLIPFVLEHSSELLEYFADECHPAGPLDTFGALYRKAETELKKLNPFQPVPSHVRLITLSASTEGRYVTGNYCAARAFTARLLRKIASAEPAAIVIDWSNDKRSCPPNDPATTDFHNTIKDLVATHPRMPILCARSTLDAQSFEKEFPEEAKKLPKSVLASEAYFPRPDVLDDTAVSFATIRLDCDLRRIPHSRNVYATFEDAQAARKPVSMESLAVTAVKLSNHARVLEAPRLKKLWDAGKDPYVQLMDLKTFDETHAIDLICNQRPAGAANYLDCKEDEGKPEELNALQHKIVIVADVSAREDYHDTSIGSVTGALLHANYIEALIADTYLKPVALPVQLLASLLWFVLIEYMFAAHADRPLTALGWSLLVIIVVLFLSQYLLRVLMRYQFDLLPPSLLLISVRACYALGEKQGRQSRQAAPTDQKSTSETKQTEDTKEMGQEKE